MNPWLSVAGVGLAVGVASYVFIDLMDQWRARRQAESRVATAGSGSFSGGLAAPLSRVLAGDLPERTIQIIALATGVTFVAAVVLRSLPLVLVGSLMAILAVLAWSQRQRWSVPGRIRRQLPDAIDVMANAISAGGTLYSGLEAASREIPLPLGVLLRDAVARCNVNQTVPESLAELRDESGSEEVSALVAALEIQRTTGGNLSGLLRETSRFLRDELRLRAEARALSAQARYSAMLVGFMPVVLFVLFSVFFPSYVEPLTSGSGLILLIYCALSTAFGFFLISQIAQQMESA